MSIRYGKIVGSSLTSSLLDISPWPINISSFIIRFNVPRRSSRKSAALQPDRKRVHIVNSEVSVSSSIVSCKVDLFVVVPSYLGPGTPVIPAYVIEERTPHRVQGQDLRIADHDQQCLGSRNGNYEFGSVGDREEPPTKFTIESTRMCHEAESVTNIVVDIIGVVPYCRNDDNLPFL